MKKSILCIVLVATNLSAQTKFWKVSSEADLSLSKKALKPNTPKVSQQKIYTLNLEGIKAELKKSNAYAKNGTNYALVDFPDLEGNLSSYKVWEKATMEEELATQHPDMKSYVAENINNPLDKIYFTINDYFGLSALSHHGEQTYEIQAISNDHKTYSYHRKNDIQKADAFVCGVTNAMQSTQPAPNAPNLIETGSYNSRRMNDGLLREYRMAFATTIEFSRFHYSRANLPTNATTAQKQAAVLAALNTIINDVNSVYERDLSVRFKLIAKNTDVIFIDSDQFTNNDSNAVYNESQSIITQTIGEANFDIGHTGSTGPGGYGNYAPCLTGKKAYGMTGLESPIGPVYTIDYVAHEVGHQFGAQHIFNDSCNNNRFNSTAVEPGSGSSILGYAGVSDCANQVQSTSDNYFNTVSLAQMVAQITTGGSNCGKTTSNTNTKPVISGVANYTIPKSTAFVLSGTAVDAEDQDSLTYCWEQIDNQVVTQPPVANSTGGPTYRSLPPVKSNKRYFPVFSSVLAGNLIPKWEVTPSVGRTLNFALTVRDNHAAGGHYSRTDSKITVNNTAGPFSISSQATTGITYNGNSTQNITWNVAGTTANGVNTADVKISLSTDAGATFATVLTPSTPNTGSFTATMPNVTAANCRIMVEAVGNVFYAVNNKAFALKQVLGTQDLDSKNFGLSPNPNNGSFQLKYQALSRGDISISVIDMVGNTVYQNTYSNSPELTENFNLNLTPGIYTLKIQEEANISTKKFIVK
jgi:Metallo-peptidase family M12B Reprolysin-like/Secretion system C-terminal sorting domain